MTDYRAFGLRVHSAFPVPGALPLSSAEASDPPDLVIVEGEVRPEAATAAFGPYRVTGRGLLFEKTGVARFLCDVHGHHITVQPAPGTARSEAAAYLIATAIPAALWIRGELVLHAAAAVLPGAHRALAFLGPSGSGKSTLLQDLTAQGSSVVAEDAVCLSLEGGAVQGSGLPGCLFLRSAGASLHDQRRACEVPRSRCLPEARIAAMLVLKTDGCQIEGPPLRLHGTDALQALLRHRHRPAVPRLLGLETALLPRWAAISHSIPVYSWNPKQTLGARACDTLLASAADSTDEQEA